MKTFVLIRLFFLSMAAARAGDWKELRPGCEKQVVLEAVGAPLMMNKSKTGRQETWTYDRGGYVIFENGRVSFWVPSRGRSGAKVEAASLGKAPVASAAL